MKVRRKIEKGMRFGTLVVTEIPAKNTIKCTCQCDCGNTKQVNKYLLLDGKCLSCGCKTKELREKTNKAKFGVAYPTQDPEKMEQIKRTNNERYGGNAPSKSAEVREKMKKTCLDRYGVENAFQSEEKKEKIRQMHIKKRGVPYPTQSSDVMEKQMKTCAERYGADNYFATTEFIKLTQSNDFYTSRGERELRDFVRSLGVFTEKIRRNGMEVDVYCPDYKVGIEYNGLYWHSEANRERVSHFRKTKYFSQKEGIKLIQIFEHEWSNRQDQVRARLRSLLSKCEISVGARKCSITELGKGTVRDFLEQYHIQGYASLHTAFALEYDSEVVAVATFAKHHRDSSKITMSRFCCKDGYTIPGGLSRLSKHASQYFRQDIVSWCDLRWSDGNGYRKAGWVEDAILKPDYFYYNSNTNRVISKQSRKKSTVNTPEGMTEYEHARQDGLLRVYDCGKIRFVYPYSL